MTEELWDGLERDARGLPVAPLVRDLADRARGEALALRDGPGRHGDLPRWLAALEALPPCGPHLDLDRAAPRLGAAVGDQQGLAATLMELHPWRKGPLELGGLLLDTEWRSDWKWSRIEPHLTDRVTGRAVLDVGCGNGYFGWRLLGAGARLVVGVDPTPLFMMQWLAQRHFAVRDDGWDHARENSRARPANWVLPLRDTDLPTPDSGVAADDHAGFDFVLSLGVIYHRKDPLDHLRRLRGVMRPGGELVLETLVLNRDGDALLEPARVGNGRYARMRNVWGVPTPERVLRWMTDGGFSEPRLADLTPTSTGEQRSTPWMRFESLSKCLDPERPELTVEGHPAPVRGVFLARRP